MPKKTEAPKLGTQDFALLALEHIKLKQDEKKLKAAIEKVRKRIDDSAPGFVKEVASGNKEWVGEHAGVRIRVQYQKRVSSSLVPEVEELLIENKLDKEYMEEITVVKREALETAIKAGEISPGLVKDLYTTSITYALSIKTELPGAVSDEPLD